MTSKQFQNNLLEVGLLRGLSATRARLNASAAILTVAAVALCMGAVHYIETSSSSVAINMLIISACIASVILAGYIQAVWIGDRVWTDMWRLQVVQGQEAAPGELPARPRHIEFMILCAALIFINGFALDRSRGGFFERYNHEGFFEVRLRSPDPQERIAALRAMSDPLQVKLWERPGVRALVQRTLRQDADAEVLAWAAWNAGAMKVDIARPELLALVNDAARPEAARAEAALALARLGADAQASEAVAALLASPKAPLQIAALRAMALMGSVGGAEEQLKALTAGADAERALLAMWALREGKPAGLRAWLRAELESPALKAGQRRCALLDALKMNATEEDVDWARLQYVREPAEERCEPVYWDERDERRNTLLFGDTTRVKLLKVVANAGGVVKHPDWFRRIAQDDREPQHARELASLILQQADRYQPQK
jgi:hypothetical protein